MNKKSELQRYAENRFLSRYWLEKLSQLTLRLQQHRNRKTAQLLAHKGML